MNQIKLYRLLLLLVVPYGCVHHSPEGSPQDQQNKQDELSGVTQQYDDFVIPIYSTNRNAEWTLVWKDEFHHEDSLSNWSLQDWPSDKNGEWQYYSPENVSVEDGFLIIESRKERFKGRDYTSGAVTTEEKFEFTYGKVEIRAKLPEGQGIFPAFWLVNSDGDNWLPEIDMLEYLGQYPNELHYVVHWENTLGEKSRDYFHYKSDEVNFSNDFHTYGLQWEPNKITWILDGTPIFESKAFSPDIPLYLYINTAIGGFWPGNPDPFDEYPKQMQIEYVRIFQKEIGR